MAKRFTDTTKWKRPWFRELGLHAKLTWQYLCDECDHAGIWIADFRLASFQLDFKVDEAKLREWLGDKLVKISEDKYFIPSFFEFQYGNSDAGFRAKQGALRELDKHGLLDESGKSLKDLSKTYLVSVSLIEAHGTSKGTSTSTGKEGGAGETIDKVSQQDLEQVYLSYPRKKGKANGIAIAKREVKTKSDLAALSSAISNYVRNCKEEKKDAKFILHFSTFMGEWRDWLDPEHGKSESFAAPSIADIELPDYGKAGA